MSHLDRRQFSSLTGLAGLTGLGGSALGRLVGADPRPAATTDHRKWQPRKALKLNMIRDGASLRSKFAMAKRLGFDGIELDSPNQLDLNEVREARDETGVVIHGVVDAVHWRDTLSHPDAATRARGVAALETALDDAKAYGATTVLLVPGVVNKEVSYAKAYERSQAEIRKVLPKATGLGVKIAFENVWNHFLLSPLEFARYIDEFESPTVGAYLDAGNLVRFGWPQHWIEALGSRILKVDVKDFSRQKMNANGPWSGFAVPLGEGDTDWPAVVEALKGVGYNGWFTAELEGGGEDRLALIAEQMGGFLKPE